MSGETIHYSPVSEIIVPEDRVRKEFDKSELIKLADSIKGRRQDTPGICYLNKEGKPVLVAGERRLRACELAGVEFCYRLEEDTDPLRILEIEVEENIFRVDLTWAEEVDAIARLHKLKQKIHGDTSTPGKRGWTERDTAKIAGKSLGSTHEDIELSIFSQALPEIRGAKTKTEAKKRLKKIKESMKRSEALQKARLRKVEEGDEAPEEDISSLEAQLRYYDKFVLRGKMEDILPKQEKPFDVVIFDPPWGVELGKVTRTTPDQDYFDDSPEQLNYYEDWLKLLWDHMSENSHLYMFFGIVNHEFIYSLLEKIGFTVNRLPIFWQKIGAHVTRNPEVWPGRCYEAIAYARKGSKPLVTLGAPDIIATPMPTPRLKENHPSAKHPMVYLDLLKRSCSPGDRVLDPMAGSGMLGVAAEVLRPTHQLDWIEIEQDPKFCDLAVNNVAQGYFALTQNEGKKEENNAPA